MELSNLRHVSLGAGKPDVNMTDEYWQQYFGILKAITTQSKNRRMKCSHAKTIVNGKPDETVYHGETQYTNYCYFINSVLKTIRGYGKNPPQHDYCFFIYQIADLLRFEHDRLRTKWIPRYECFEVWLSDD